ncbi:MAG: DUF479 domain-containing protein [Planctomycetes bacterium]|nr:DUF479 domain-containing protein [Planctomycetota bacterium]
MNYLAHLALADDTPESLLGNLAGDFLHGLDPACIAPELRPGIANHRAIDRFTDAHPVVAQARGLLAPSAGHFSGVLLDVYFDHFLARDFNIQHGQSLQPFAQRVYAALESHRHLLPPRLAEAAPVMIRHDWLAAYAHTEGVGVILQRMVHRTRRGATLAHGAAWLQRHYQELEAAFNDFYPQLRKQFRQ